MLVSISPLLSPELLAVLCRMGHGDEIVLADAHFPGHSCNDLTLRADGLKIDALLEAILPLFALDTYVESAAFVMDPVPGDSADPQVRATYEEIVARRWPDAGPVAGLERFAFYERAQAAFAVVMTGDVAKYGNIILKKGVTPV
jgi:L-fucose mutarotase